MLGRFCDILSCANNTNNLLHVGSSRRKMQPLPYTLSPRGDKSVSEDQNERNHNDNHQQTSMLVLTLPFSKEQTADCDVFQLHQ